MSKKYHYIYQITHKTNGFIYIGIHSTDDLQDGYFANGIYEPSGNDPFKWRKLNHGHKESGYQHIRNAMIKYGREAFSREILEWCETREMLIQRESELVDRDFIERTDTYNNRTGGYANTQFSDVVRKQISDNNPMHRKQVREKVSRALKDSWTDERKKHLSVNNPMKDPEIATKLSGQNSVWWGRSHTEETRKLISDAKKGSIRPKEAIESQRLKIKEYWSDPERTAKRKDVKGIKKPDGFGRQLSDRWKEKIQIIDTKTGKIYHSLAEIQQLLADEGKVVGIPTVSDYVRGKKGKRSGLDTRFKYLKNPKHP